MASLSRAAIVAAAVAVLASSCNAAVLASDRLAIQQMGESSSSSLRAAVSPDMNIVRACGANESPLVVDPADVEIWLASPITRQSRAALSGLRVSRCLCGDDCRCVICHLLTLRLSCAACHCLQRTTTG